MAGAGFKTFNTGDVLTASDVNTYLMQQTVMVFADSSARTTALGANVAEGMISYLKDTNAVEVYNGSAWVSSDDPNAIQNTIVDAKGDIITATAADTPARLAVGSDGYTLVADSAATTGLNWSGNLAGGKNFSINGGFDFWQRSTSSATLGAYATADRWYQTGAGTVTFSRDTDVPSNVGLTYSAKWTTGAGSSYGSWFQALESQDVNVLKGRTVTLSAWVKVSAGFTGTASLTLQGGTTADTLLGGTWSDTFTGSFTPTTSWVRYSVTGTVSSSAGLRITLGPGSTQANGTSLWVTGWQLELGNAMTTFSRAGGTIQGELAACQRYYYRVSGTTGVNQTAILANTAVAYSTTIAVGYLALPVTMRTAPTVLDSSNVGFNKYDETRFGALTSMGISTSYTNTNNVDIYGTTSGLTAGWVGALVCYNGTGYIGVSAEL